MSKLKKVVMSLFAAICVVTMIGATNANAEEIKKVTMPVIDNYSDSDSVSALYVQKINIPETYTGTQTNVFSFEIKQDSWIYFSAKYPGAGNGTSDIHIYSDSMLTNDKGYFAIGWFSNRPHTYSNLYKKVHIM